MAARFLLQVRARVIGIVALFSSFAFVLVAPGVSLAQAPATSAQQDAQQGLTNTAATAVLGTAKDLDKVIGLLIKGGLSLIGVVFLLLMIYSGIRWMTAQGDPDPIKKSKDTIIAAIIGLAIVGLAYAITTYVLNALITATK